MIRRRPEAILTALRMDPDRVDLYVEGERDRMFLIWISGRLATNSTRVLPMKFVELPDVSVGGGKGKLMEFAREVNSQHERIRFFADADFDRLLSRDVPPLVWLTDNRDLEGYVLSLSCLDRVLKLGLAVDQPTPDWVFDYVCRFGRKLGLLRLLSETQGMCLPFQNTSLSRYLRWKNDLFELRFEDYLRSLLQNAAISLKKLRQVEESLSDLEYEHENTPDSEIIHGKDALFIIDKLLQKSGIGKDASEKLLWCSFNTESVKLYPNLKSVVEYLRSGAVS